MGMDFFAKAGWINKERVTVYPRIFVAFYAIAIVLMLALSPHLIDPNGKNIGTDFMTVWSAGKLAQQGHAADAYDFQKHYAVQRAALPWKAGQHVPYYGWFYPPLFMAVAAALAFLSYGWALAVWMAATLPAYLATIRAILPDRRALMAALAFPGVFVNLGHGQNGFVTAALLGGGLVLLEKRPYIAGILFGLLAYKPQFGILIPLALLVSGGHRRTIISAAVTVLTEIAASYALFGRETWLAFFNSMKQTQKVALEQGAVGWERIQSIFAAVRMLGGSVELAYIAQALFAVVAAAVVLWIWRSRASMELKSAALVTASLMVTPYLLDYDLMVLALPVAWLAALGLREGFRRWEKITLLAVWVLPLLSRLLAKYLYLPTAPLVMALLLLLIVKRARADKVLT